MLVVDANIAVKFVTNESGRAEAFARTDSESVLIAPDWMLVEAGHALWRKAKLSLIDEETAIEALASLHLRIDFVGTTLAHSRDAQRLAFRLDHWIYDCIYLALALEKDAILLTADRKFWNAAKRAGYDRSIELLTWPGQMS